MGGILLEKLGMRRLTGVSLQQPSDWDDLDRMRARLPQPAAGDALHGMAQGVIEAVANPLVATLVLCNVPGRYGCRRWKFPLELLLPPLKIVRTA